MVVVGNSTAARLRSRLAAGWLGIAFLGAVGACGEPFTSPSTNLASPTEARTGELRSFGSWINVPNGDLEGWVIAPSDSGGTTIVGAGMDKEVYTTNNRDPGGFGAVWHRVSNFGFQALCNTTPSPCYLDGRVLGRVAAAGLLGEGSMPNAIAVAYISPVDRQLLVRVQNLSGSVVYDDWYHLPALPFPIFDVSMTYTPSYSNSSTPRKLLLVVRGNDSYVYIAGNSLVGGYNHSNWTTFQRMLVPGDPLIQDGPRDVDIAWACPPFANSYSLVVAATRAVGSAQYEVVYSIYNALGGGWSAWTGARNGIVDYHIGLSAGCAEGTQEMSLFGTGTDGFPYVTRQIGGGPQTWAPVGTGTKIKVAAAGYSEGRAWVSGKGPLAGVSHIYYNSAVAP